MADAFFFLDLTPEAQCRFLSAQGLSCAADGNYDMDLVPIFIVEHEEDAD